MSNPFLARLMVKPTAKQYESNKHLFLVKAPKKRPHNEVTKDATSSVQEKITTNARKDDADDDDTSSIEENKSSANLPSTKKTKIRRPKKQTIKTYVIDYDSDESESDEKSSKQPSPPALEPSLEPALEPALEPSSESSSEPALEPALEPSSSEPAPDLDDIFGEDSIDMSEILGQREIPKDIFDTNRLPKKANAIGIRVPEYVMNNRKKFVSAINSAFSPFKEKLKNLKESISCEKMGDSNAEMSLLLHQEIVRDYMNLYTPYRGLLLYHGLGSGKTCTSIAIAEGMKDSKRVIVMTPASLRANYLGQLKKCGDSLFKKNQYWQWISTDEASPDLPQYLSTVLGLPKEYIRDQKGAFLVNVRKQSNYDQLSDKQKILLESQLDKMIEKKYEFINYNGIKEKRFKERTNNYQQNIFSNAVVIIDEAHNFISLIVNKLKKEIVPVKNGSKQVQKFHEEKYLFIKMYEMLLSAKNARIVLLTGTPIINYPNEIGILFNILRGYITTWHIKVRVDSREKVDKGFMRKKLLQVSTLDYLDYSPANKVLTVTRNPFGFKNKVEDGKYKGVEKMENRADYVSDEAFLQQIQRQLEKVQIVFEGNPSVNYYKALPDDADTFKLEFIDELTGKLKNESKLKSRILGLSSYFRSAQESLLPKYDKAVDYHVVKIPMSNRQFNVHASERYEERKSEGIQPKKKSMLNPFEIDPPSSYRIYSRLACNFVFDDNRPRAKMFMIKGAVKQDEEANDEVDEDVDVNNDENTNDELKDDEIDKQEGKNTMDKKAYLESLNEAIQEMVDKGYLSKKGLQKYSPKFLRILENIQDPKHEGLNLVYSQFRTAEGIGIFSIVLNQNGFTQFKIKKHGGRWMIDIAEEDLGKPTYALYTGTESSEEKELVRKIYNGEWDDIPDSLSTELRERYTNNNLGEVIKVFMITSSGSEGINLRNTRYVHLMEPFWHPVRLEQVIGRARRICSHKALPEEMQNIEVFVYLMTMTEKQIAENQGNDLSKRGNPPVPFTTDEYLYELSEIKGELAQQLTDAIKQSSFDCFIYSGDKCVNFGNPSIEEFAYAPDYTAVHHHESVQVEQETFKAKEITYQKVRYYLRLMDNGEQILYDWDSINRNRIDSSYKPIIVGKLKLGGVDKDGKKMYKVEFLKK